MLKGRECAFDYFLFVYEFKMLATTPINERKVIIGKSKRTRNGM